MYSFILLQTRVVFSCTQKKFDVTWKFLHSILVSMQISFFAFTSLLHTHYLRSFFLNKNIPKIKVIFRNQKIQGPCYVCHSMPQLTMLFTGLARLFWFSSRETSRFIYYTIIFVRFAHFADFFKIYLNWFYFFKLLKNVSGDK